MTGVNLGRIGVWSTGLRFGDQAAIPEAAVEIDELGFGAIWIPGGAGGDILDAVDRLLRATRRLTVATGIINIWKHEPGEIAGWWKALPADHQSRVLLGLGVSHGPMIGDAYAAAKPLHVMRNYLDRLEAEGLPGNRLCIAALAPRMLELARERTAGAHPYLVTPEHTAWARGILGPGTLLAPEQGVMLETDNARARERAESALTHYRRLPNYINSWLRLGFSQDEIDRLDNRLLEALFAWGGIERIKARIDAHFGAGASHVAVQAITGGDIAADRAAWRVLAANLL